MPLASLNSTGKTNQVRQHGAMEFSDPPVDLDKVRPVSYTHLTLPTKRIV